MEKDFLIIPATREDFPEIWPFFREIISTGDTYSYDPEMSYQDACDLWFSSDREVYKAVINGKIAGTCYLRPNQLGLGNHIANGGFMVSSDFRRQGIGRKMGQAMIEKAKEIGYLGIQYNFVVSSNKKALALWQSLGFAIVGTVPNGYRHKELGLVPIHIMYRAL